MGMIWELGQSRKIRQAEATAAQGAAQAGALEAQVRRLEGRVDKLAVVCEALWSLLAERTELSEDDLLARVEQLAADKTGPDGKPKNRAKCPKCGREVVPQNNRCFYCGAAVSSPGGIGQVL